MIGIIALISVIYFDFFLVDKDINYKTKITKIQRRSHVFQYVRTEYILLWAPKGARLTMSTTAVS